MMLRIALIAIYIIVLLAPLSIQARAAFQPDRRTGCKLDITYDKRNMGPRSFEWSGQCVDGYAEGYGTITYYASNRKYWVSRINAGSGMIIRRGRFHSDFDLRRFHFRLTNCNASSMQVVIELPPGLNLQLNQLFWQIIKTGSDFAASRTMPVRFDRRRHVPCVRFKRDGKLWRRSKEIVLYQSGQQIAWARSARRTGRFFVPRTAFRYGDEIWVKWNNHKLAAAERNRATVFNTIVRDQRNRRRLAQQQARNRQAEARRAAMAAAVKQQQAAESVRQNAIQKRVEALRKEAAADAQARDRRLQFCVSSCDPTEAHGRNALKQLLASKIDQPIVVLKFRKTNGVRGKKDGFDIYELYYHADIEFPAGFITKPPPTGFNFLHGTQGHGIMVSLNSVMRYEMNGGKKWWQPISMTAKGKIRLRQTEQDWEAVRLLK